jgi:ubiquinone/menaquinone biosynthesis C-methylase UbiE
MTSHDSQNPVHEPHSAKQFGKQRDSWWNSDFLDLLASRTGLKKCRQVLDVGAGLGHWSNAILPCCDPEATITCVDNERQWVSSVKAKILQRSVNTPEVMSIFSDAEELGLPDDTYDLVTCQTVLMHLKNPIEAVREMIRVAKPGGLILIVEPNNFNNYIQLDSLSWNQDVDKHSALYAFWMYCNRGRILEGCGNDAIGQVLPKIMQEAGLSHIEMCLSDKAYPVFPPYQSPYEIAWIEESCEGSSLSGSSEEELVRVAMAGGASKEFAQRGLDLLREKHALIQRAIADDVFYSAGGSLMYIAWSRKPE